MPIEAASDAAGRDTAMSEQTVDLGRMTMAYRDVGPAGGVPVLLIHGFASNAAVNWAGTGWIKTLTEAGYRVIALDNRGHGKSQKFYEAADYGPDIFADDAVALLDHLGISRAHVIGYSMGGRITAWLAHAHGERMLSAVIGGMGANIGGRGTYEEVAAALEADDPATIEDRHALSFRKFADATGADRLALAACIRPSNTKITSQIVASIAVPTLVVVGSQDDIAGPAEPLAEAMVNARAVTLPGLDHMKATGAPGFKDAAIAFLKEHDPQ